MQIKKAESENKSPVNYNMFLNTVLLVINKIKRNREEVNADIFEYFINKYMRGAEEVSGYTDFAAAAVADSMDFVNIDGAASSVSRNLYSSAKKEVKEELKKKIVKDTVSEAGEQALKKKVNDIAKSFIEKVDDIVGNSINHDTFELQKDIDIFISKQKMYQDGKHFNKHGRNMDYTNKKEYNEAA